MLIQIHLHLKAKVQMWKIYQSDFKKQMWMLNVGPSEAKILWFSFFAMFFFCQKLCFVTAEVMVTVMVMQAVAHCWSTNQGMLNLLSPDQYLSPTPTPPHQWNTTHILLYVIVHWIMLTCVQWCAVCTEYPCADQWIWPQGALFNDTQHYWMTL